jgi:hypothetical protein
LNVGQLYTKTIRWDAGGGEMKQPTLHYEQKDSAVEFVEFFIPKIHHTHAFSDVGGVLVGRLAIKNVTPPWLSIFATVTIIIG